MFMRALGVILTTTTTSEETNKMLINVSGTTILKENIRFLSAYLIYNCINTISSDTRMLQYIHYRARLKLYHPSQQECKTRCCEDSDTGTEGYSSDGEQVQNNRISLDRSDSLIIHDVPETVPIDKKKGKIDSSQHPVEQSPSNAVHSLLQSIRDETEKYLVTQEGTLILGSEMLYSFRFITITHFAI